MPDKPEETEPPEQSALLLHLKLRRLLRVKEDLQDECRPVPPELEEQIQETRKELGLE